jgi:hypothetical protein
MSFTLKILTGLLLGIFTGLFLGEIAAPFSVAGEVFIGLLQMTVLLYIVVPQPLTVKVPLGYPLPRGDKEWTRFVSTWVELEQKNGTVDSLFEHWIRGGGARPTEPRWSIIRDVLHWVD